MAPSAEGRGRRGVRTLAVISLDGSAQHIRPPSGHFLCAGELWGPKCDRTHVIWARENLRNKRTGAFEDALMPYCQECAARRRDMVAQERGARYAIAGLVENQNHWVGLCAEVDFARRTSLVVDFRNSGSDGGVDFVTVSGRGIDVKCTQLDSPQWKLPLDLPAHFYVFYAWPQGPRHGDRLALRLCGVLSSLRVRAIGRRVGVNGSTKFGVVPQDLDPAALLFDLLRSDKDVPDWWKLPKAEHEDEI